MAASRPNATPKSSGGARARARSHAARPAAPWPHLDRKSWSCLKESVFLYFASSTTSTVQSLLKSVDQLMKQVLLVVMRWHVMVCTALNVGAAGSDSITSQDTDMSSTEYPSWRIFWIVLSE